MQRPSSTHAHHSPTLIFFAMENARNLASSLVVVVCGNANMGGWHTETTRPIRIRYINYDCRPAQLTFMEKVKSPRSDSYIKNLRPFNPNINNRSKETKFFFLYYSQRSPKVRLSRVEVFAELKAPWSPQSHKESVHPTLQSLLQPPQHNSTTGTTQRKIENGHFLFSD